MEMGPVRGEMIAYTNKVCRDDPKCLTNKLIDKDMCMNIDEVRHECPKTCGDCCEDDMKCSGMAISDAVCSQFADIRKQCPRTCATCPIFPEVVGKHLVVENNYRLLC